MTMKIGIVVFSGLPAVGKTTLARKLMCFCETEAAVSQLVTASISEIHSVHVCYDDIMTSRLYGNNSEAEENSWKMFRKYIRLCTELEILSLLENGLLLEEELKEPDLTANDQHVMEDLNRKLPGMCSDCSQIPEDVLLRYMKSKKIKRRFCDEGDILFVFLIDDNMFLRSMRYEYYQLARKYGTGFCQISIRCSADEAQQQNSKRNIAQSVQVSQSTIVTMARKFEVPDVQIQWEALSLVLDRENCCNNGQMCEVWQMIIESVFQPVDKPEVIDEELKTLSRLVCSQNILHQVDQILRREIGRQLKIIQSEKMTKKENFRKQAAFLNEKKRSLLEDMRNGKIGFPKNFEKHIKDACRDERNPCYIYVKEVFCRSGYCQSMEAD